LAPKSASEAAQYDPEPRNRTIRSVRTLLVMHVRQALQQIVTIGACSPHFPAA